MTIRHLSVHTCSLQRSPQSKQSRTTAVMSVDILCSSWLPWCTIVCRQMREKVTSIKMSAQLNVSRNQFPPKKQSQNVLYVWYITVTLVTVRYRKNRKRLIGPKTIKHCDQTANSFLPKDVVRIRTSDKTESLPVSLVTSTTSSIKLRNL